MKEVADFRQYRIRDIIDFRDLTWPESEDFLYFTSVPTKFEPYFVKPDYFCFGMITNGKLAIQIGENEYDLTQHSIMVYRPGQVFKVSEIAEGTTGAFILFTKKFLDFLNENIFSVKDQSFLSYGIRNIIELNEEDREKILSIFTAIFQLLEYLSRPDWELIARNLTSALIYETDNLLKKYIVEDHAIVNRDDFICNQFRILVALHFREHRELQFYSSKLCTTQSSLYTSVKKTSGTNPTAILNEKVIAEVKYLLGSSTENFSEIADQLHFPDLFTFSKFFKKQTGFSPTAYRRQLKVPGMAKLDIF